MGRNDKAAASADREVGRRVMSDQLVSLVRARLASRFYDEPTVVDALARAILPALRSEAILDRS